MKTYQYKTVELELDGLGLFGPKKTNSFERTLNEMGAQGWRYVDTVRQTGIHGKVFSLQLVFEQERD